MTDHKDILPDVSVNGAVKNVEEILFSLFLVAEKCKERFADGVQWTDFISLSKFLIADSEFRKSLHDAMEDLTLMKAMLLRLNILDMMALYHYSDKLIKKLVTK